MTRLITLLRRFRRDESGAFMVIFAVLGLVLIAASGAVVDFTRVEQARTRAQTALDSAALALQTRISTDNNATLKSKAQTILTERLADATITATVSSVTTDTDAGKLNLQANITVPTAFVQLVGITSIRSNLQSEVTRGSNDVEVSVALDVTGSMLGTKISDLISATNTLIDLVVQDTQTPTYSKMAIVPWSAAVNVGTYAAGIRGAVRGPWTSSNVTWMSGTQSTVSAVTKASQALVTTNSANGFAAGDYVYFSGISGMTQISGQIYQVASITSTTQFKINVNTTNYSSFSYNGGSGKVVKCITPACELVVTTSTSHSLNDGEQVYLTGFGGTLGTSINNRYFTVDTPPSPVSFTNNFVLDGTNGPGYASYSSAGSSACIVYGCSLYYFKDASSTSWSPSYSQFPVTTCVTERTTQPYTDTGPATLPLSYHYASSSNGCISQTIQPLTSNKTTLHALTNSLSASGSTAGQLGLAWGWYMISPNFASLWPTASQPKAYASANLIKAVILMTDGDFNTPYCTGVIAKDAGTGSGSTGDHINCNSPNGSSKAQAQALCNSIKASANQTILYTVGFDLAGSTDALTFLQNCATDTDHFFQADTGADLTKAFQEIAKSLSDLRLSK